MARHTTNESLGDAAEPRKKKPAYLPLYVRDWYSDPLVAGLPWIERQIYLCMLMLAWERGPLPDDTGEIELAIGWRPLWVQHVDNQARAELMDIHAIIPWLLERFFHRTESGWVNLRLERERAHFYELEEAKKIRTAAATAARQRNDQRNDQRNEVQAQAQAQAQKKNQSAEKNPPTPQGGRAKKSSQQILPGTESPHVAARAAWDRVWAERGAGAFAWSARHAVAMVEVVKLAAEDHAEIERRARNLILAGSDAWLAQRASPSFLLKYWNELAVVVVPHTFQERDRLSREQRARERMAKAKAHDEATNRAALPAPAGRAHELGTG